MLTLEMLPAAHGDCLWLEYGTADNIHRILIDGGPGSCYEHLRWRIIALPQEQRRFELLVITHVDADHIEGVVKLLQDDDLGCQFDDIWFNDWVQIDGLTRSAPSFGPSGAVQGEFLGALIETMDNQAWNSAFAGQAICVTPQHQPLPSFTTAGGLKLTVLSPTRETLESLREVWEEAVREAGFETGNREQALRKLRTQKRLGPPTNEILAESGPSAGISGIEGQPDTLDHSANNGSSIALLAEFNDKRLLLSGDAFAPELRQSLDRWLQENGESRVELDAFKLPHHGSSNNITPQLLSLLKCKHYLISTSGARFNHPDAEAIDLILEHHNARGKPHLHFNYLTEDTAPWADAADQKQRRYEAHYPAGNTLELY